MLGVATLIVVNSVMSGFSNKLKDRLHGTSADLTVGTEFFGGFEEHPDYLSKAILASRPGQHLEAIAPCIDVVGTIQFTYRGRTIVKPVKLMGIDPIKQAQVGKFSQYLVNQRNSEAPGFTVTDTLLTRFRARLAIDSVEPVKPPAAPGGGDFLGEGPKPIGVVDAMPVVPLPDLPTVEAPKPIGIIVGDMLAHWRYKDPKTGQPVEETSIGIGDPVMVATLAADGARPVYSTYVVMDYFKSEMSEYDSQFVYLPIEEVQRLRQMSYHVNSLQMKLKLGTDRSYGFVKANVAMPLQELMPRESGTYVVTWEDTQGPLLSAIDIERGILNILLFMIVGVAGFSILAIFTMIVSEKYRDIGILKSLGASNRGVLGIFVWYAIFLGIVGCAAGTGLGISITRNINEIETAITKLTGQQLFDRSVYYFDSIPTNIENITVVIVNIGAMLVAILSSLVPAVRAARLRPIQALRFE
jgi:lipoprotein-releasing system permease protein